MKRGGKAAKIASTTNRNHNAGFRRILYDAMVLSASLRAVKECNYSELPSKEPSRIDDKVEAHHTNALIQLRSMVAFLNCEVQRNKPDMTAEHFGCKKQNVAFPKRQSANAYAAHKSWDAIKGSAAATAGVPRITKKELLAQGKVVLAGFVAFRREFESKYAKLKMNGYAMQYDQLLKQNMAVLDQANSP